MQPFCFCEYFLKACFSRPKADERWTSALSILIIPSRLLPLKEKGGNPPTENWKLLFGNFESPFLWIWHVSVPLRWHFKILGLPVWHKNVTQSLKLVTSLLIATRFGLHLLPRDRQQKGWNANTLHAASPVDTNIGQFCVVSNFTPSGRMKIFKHPVAERIFVSRIIQYQRCVWRVGWCSTGSRRIEVLIRATRQKAMWIEITQVHRRSVLTATAWSRCTWTLHGRLLLNVASV